jgi:hypothetical protein
MVDDERDDLDDFLDEQMQDPEFARLFAEAEANAAAERAVWGAIFEGDDLESARAALADCFANADVYKRRMIAQSAGVDEATAKRLGF